MSDREIIIKSLERVERRIRANRLLHETALGLSIFLAIPLALKLLDLFSPFRAQTITVLIGLWLVSFVAYLAYRFRGKSSLHEAAASVDSKAQLYDGIKTAYWFINNPRSSEWVDAQISRAARDAERLNVDQLFPRDIPRASYAATAMILAFVVLNFLPLPFNHNWLQLQAAPAFILTDNEQSLFARAQELLRQAEQMQQSELAEQLQELMQQLQEGKVDPAMALQQLRELQNQLEEGNLDIGSINAGLEEMGKDMEQSEAMKEAGAAMMNKQLKDAADELRELSEKMGMQSAEDTREMQEALQQAAENNRPGLEQLSKELKDAANNLKNENTQEAQKSLDKAAQELEELAEKMQSQALKNQASQQLQNLEESLRQRQQGEQQQQQQGQQSGQQQGQQQQGQGQQGQGQQDQMGEGQQTAAGEEGQQGQPGQQGPPGAADDANNSGTGMMPSGNPGGNAPREGAPTKLEVQLEQEKLTGLHDEGTKQEELEEASKQERSKLDYRNVKSELSPAQKDLLNQDRIPWEYRPLIKNYFQAIRPPEKK